MLFDETAIATVQNRYIHIWCLTQDHCSSWAMIRINKLNGAALNDCGCVQGKSEDDGGADLESLLNEHPSDCRAYNHTLLEPLGQSSVVVAMEMGQDPV